jgi:acyl-CoA synthetase (AMP-forming)/AMP-acid ligase II
MNALLQDRIAHTLAAAQGRALGMRERWHDWREVGAVADVISRALDQAGIAPSTPVGLVARNRPGVVAAYLTLLARGLCVVSIHPAQQPAAIASDIRRQRLAAVIAHGRDWEESDLFAATAEAGSMGIVVEDDPVMSARQLPGLERPRSDSHRAPLPGVAVEMLTSGTTGAPKRVPMRYSTLKTSVEDLHRSRIVMGEDELDTPLVEYQPLVGIGGVYYAAYAGTHARPYMLQEKFEPLDYARAIAAYRPKVIGLNPALMRMVIAARVPPESFASLLAVRSGSAPLDEETRRRWEEDYAVPILHIYGATEFGGPVTYWTLEDYRAHHKTKWASAGRAAPGMALRLADRETGQPVPPGGSGMLEVTADRIGPEWIRTNDLATIDADGFLFIHGRADDAINRGGFKIPPDLIGDALRRHPAVADAAVAAMPDARLGQVPVAAVECVPSATRPSADELREFLRGQLLAYQVPVAVKVVDALPRNAALKVPREQLLALFASPGGSV